MIRNAAERLVAIADAKGTDGLPADVAYEIKVLRAALRADKTYSAA